MNVKSPRRVLIIRLSAIGDVVFASPLVAACKRTYPDAEITYKATWDAEVDRYLLTLKIDGTRSSFVEFEGKIKETPGEIYQDTLQCKQMDVDL